MSTELGFQIWFNFSRRDNPAGIAAMGKGEGTISHSTWYLGSAHDFVGAGLRLPGAGGWRAGLSFNRLSSGDIESRNADRSRGSGYTAYDQAVSLAVARQYGA